MRSARREARIARKNKKGKKRLGFLKFLIPVVVISAFYLFIRLNTHIWNGKDKVSVVFVDGGQVGVTVLDPGMPEITTLIVPGDTQVDVARNYGTFRIKNVWQLGIDEKIGGSLLAETVTQNFLFPTFLWDSSAPGLDKGNISAIINFIFLPGQTNISFGDRVRMGLFALGVQDLGKNEIDLGKSQFLVKKTLSDGTKGYVILGPISQRLTIYFSNNEIVNQNIRVNIVDSTGEAGISEKLGEIIEVIGGKVVSIDKKSAPEDIDCLISGQNADAVRKIAYLFSCKITGTKTSFDMDIRIGSKFAKRF